MLEDLEDPPNDDISVNRLPDHARTVLKTSRAYLRELKKKRKKERQLNNREERKLET